MVQKVWNWVKSRYHKPDGTLIRSRLILTAASVLLACMLLGALLAHARSIELFTVLLSAAIAASVNGSRRHVRQIAVRRDARTLTRWPWRAGRYIVPLGEVARWEGREYWMVVAKWWALLIGGFILAVALGVLSGSGILSLVVFVPATSVAGWQLLEWYVRWMIITDSYVIKITGLLVWHGPAIRIDRIEFVDPIDTPVGRAFHYRHLYFDTAAQRDPFNDLYGVINPPGTPPEQTAYGLLLRRGAQVGRKKR